MPTGRPSCCALTTNNTACHFRLILFKGVHCSPCLLLQLRMTMLYSKDGPKTMARAMGVLG